MKKAILTVVMAILPVVAVASDFGFINLNAPIVYGGSYIALDGSGNAAGGGLALITYKGIPSNNLLASIMSGFAPLTLNGTIGGTLGKASLSAGPGVNLLPAARATAYGLVKSLSADGQFNGLKAALSAPTATPDANIFIGPVWGPVWESVSQCHTEWMMMFTGSLAFK